MNNIKPKEQKIKEYVKKTKDPYHFVHNGKNVTMRFTDNGKTLEGQLEQYIVTVTGDMAL